MPALIPVVFLLSIGWVARFQFAACAEGRSFFYTFFIGIFVFEILVPIVMNVEIRKKSMKIVPWVGLE